MTDLNLLWFSLEDIFGNTITELDNVVILKHINSLQKPYDSYLHSYMFTK